MSASRQAHDIAILLPKLDDGDPDLRYMGLADLGKIFEGLPPTALTNEVNICSRVTDGLVRCLRDTNGDVQNVTINVIGRFATKLPEPLLESLIDKISSLSTENSLDRSIPALALRMIVVSLARNVPSAATPQKTASEPYTALSKALIPRLVGTSIMPAQSRQSQKAVQGMIMDDVARGGDNNSMDVLTELARYWGPMLKENEKQALQKATSLAVDSDRASPVLKKKAVAAIGALSVWYSDELLSSFVSKLVEDFRKTQPTEFKRKLLFMIVGSLARSVHRKFGQHLKVLAPIVLGDVSEEQYEDARMSQEDDDEARDMADDVREAALVALEQFLVSCPNEIHSSPDNASPYLDDIVAAASRFLTYDPNRVLDEDKDDDDFDFDDDALEGDDFEEEEGFDEDEDSSWKVRRCAAKLLNTVVTSRPHNLTIDSRLFDKLAGPLVSRFKEREDSVRLEILAALSALVQRSAEDSTLQINTRAGTTAGSMGPPPSRKRRRGASDASMLDAETDLASTIHSPTNDVPQTELQASLAKLTPKVMSETITLLNSSTLPTKQATILLLKSLVGARRGTFSDDLGELIKPLIDSIKSGSSGASGSGSSAVTANSVKLHALQLLGNIAGAQTASSLKPHLKELVGILTATASDRNGKASVEAIKTMESLALNLSSKSASPEQFASEISTLLDCAVSTISRNDTDVEVRQQALRVLGVILARSSGAEAIIPSDKRHEALQLICARLQNELLRMAAIQAVDMVASLTTLESDLDTEWIQEVSTQLGSNLRKSSRPLRAASLAALRKIVVNPASGGRLQADTVRQLMDELYPLLSTDDTHLLPSALAILSTFVRRDAQLVATPELNSRICSMVGTTVSGSPLNSLVALVKAIGEAGAGGPLMHSLLKDVGVSGNADILGKLIGTLLVFGGDSVGVKLDDFLKELGTAADGKRRCLALAVLGESGLLLGSKSPLQPSIFLEHFGSDAQQVPLSAAIGLGRAGAGNVQLYLPMITEEMKKPTGPHYLLLHSAKEILQHSEADDEVRPFAQDLWQTMISVAKVEDNKAIAAECVGRLAILEPQTFLPQLQSFLSDSNESTRGMVISALRYTFADTDEAYDDHLQPSVIDMLKTMLSEESLDNLRLALTAFNSAVYNKPQLILPSLDQLLPFVMKETVVKPDLIREVSMGPFKVKMDDGLEVRKSAYETLYSLQESAFSRLPRNELDDRIVAGITDEHDIRMLCTLMLTKLIAVAPDESRRHLEEFSTAFKSVLAQKPKETAVKQELERAAEGNRAILKVTVLIQKNFFRDGSSGDATDPGVTTWNNYVAWAKQEHANLFKAAEQEVKDKER